MAWLWTLARNYWLFLCLACAGWFVLHTGLVMLRDVQAQRRKITARRMAMHRLRDRRGDD